MTRRGWIWTVAAIAGVNLVLFAVGKLLPGTTGPESSSFATQPRGFAGWSELLETNGRHVVRERATPAEADPMPRATAVVLEPDSITARDAAALRAFVIAGGRLVAGGPRPEWLRDVAGAEVGWRLGGRRFWSPGPEAREARGVGTVVSDGRAHLAPRAGARPELVNAQGALIAVLRRGRGEVVLVADPSPFQNRLLARESNALLALRVAGPRGTPVRFYESLHGYGAAQGLRALPGHWKFALACLAAAGLVFLLARSRRLGPPERSAAAGTPPRRLYVDAIASTLARTRSRADATAPLRAHARHALEARSGSGSADVEALAKRLGMSSEEAAALARPPADDRAVVALGSASAKLHAR